MMDGGRTLEEELCIRMAGIDYERAGVELRERFSMTRGAAQDWLSALERSPQLQGCVLLSTCNRTELWVSGQADPLTLLCNMKRLEPEPYQDSFIRREGQEAVHHLFCLACGLKSQIFGEDQIITQVGEALSMARESKAADSVLETLFREAITAAKEVKTQVRLTQRDRSVAERAVGFLEEQLGALEGRPCLVIGNGEMGRLAASRLAERGANVRMTLRSYRHGEAIIPSGVDTVTYENRLEWVGKMDAVISATTSPHYTLRADQLPSLSHPVIFCDLAVPRDIDPEIGKLPMASLYDTDQICGSCPQCDQEALEQAWNILRHGEEDFLRWYQMRGMAASVQRVSGEVAKDVLGRVSRPLGKLPPSQREELSQRAEEAVRKAVSKLLFGLGEELPPQLRIPCLAALERAGKEKN